MSKPIKRYSPEEKEIIAVMFAEGRRYDDIAERVGVTYAQIKDVIHRARIGEWGDEYTERFPMRRSGGRDKTNNAGKPKKKESKPQADTLDDDIKKAHMLGMRYGYYMAVREGIIPTRGGR